MSGEPLVAVIMGSRSDWDVMENASRTLDELGIAHEVRILSAHRTPEALIQFMNEAESAGVQVFIAAAGGAAHLAGVVAGHTTKPVLGVPMESKLDGLDSLLSTVQMPAGIPVGTLAIGKAGAVNAAILAAQILGLTNDEIAAAVAGNRRDRARAVLAEGDPRSA
ncbi:MAG: 5-(carboxyamino)imidazole ribonucleotide mutase [bacterium]|nr:5-(carboxyamino)imidazole ribonucleotide mutase [bacterium]